MTYLDYAAASPLDPEVFEAMKPWLTEEFANPSSLHQGGQRARAAIDKARMQIATFLGCEPTEVFFTANGTESCNWALLGTAENFMLKGQPVHMVYSAIEHSAVIETIHFLERCYGIESTEVPVTEDGLVEIDQLRACLRPETLLVSVMTVNNEIGTLQPIDEIGALCRDRGIRLHTDACQASGYYDLNVDDLNVDMLTLNATKISGPKGVGALYVREGTPLAQWTFGGDQEFGRRAGTENVPAIVGFGAAIELLQKDPERGQRVRKLRDQLWEELKEAIPGIQQNAPASSVAPHILNVYLPDVDGESLVKKLDIAGFAVSTGSACTSGKVTPSHVITALGHDQARAQSSLRISLGKETSEAEVGAFVKTLAEHLKT